MEHVCLWMVCSRPSLHHAQSQLLCDAMHET